MFLIEGLNSFTNKTKGVVQVYATRAYGIRGGDISFTDHQPYHQGKSP